MPKAKNIVAKARAKKSPSDHQRFILSSTKIMVPDHAHSAMTSKTFVDLTS
jgi:hypothetical protein